MTKRDAVEALQALGLSTYEAQVFVTLQELGGGTAQAVSKHSEVPRSQVYGTADDLADRGLVEVVEASPKEYRPVDLETARGILTERIRRERDRAFDNIEAIRSERAAPTGGSVSTLRGRQPIDDRLAEMASTADSELVMVVPHAEYFPEPLGAALEERIEDGVSVSLVTRDAALAESFADDPAVSVAIDPAGSPGYTGRILLVDDHTVLLSVLTGDDDNEPMDEMALWTAESRIAGILAQFVHAGIERVIAENGDTERSRGGADAR